MIIMIIIRPMETESNSKSRQYIKKHRKQQSLQGYSKSENNITDSNNNHNKYQ